MRNLFRFAYILACRVLGRDSAAADVYDRMPRTSLFWQAATLNLIHVYESAGEYARAGDLCRDWQQLVGSSPGGQLWLGTVCLLGRQYERAEEILQNLVQSDSENIDALLALARTRYYLGSFEKARDTFHRVMHLQPEDSRGLSGYGLALYSLGQYEDALPILEKATQLNPDDDYAHFVLGLICLKVGDSQGALREVFNLRGLNSARADELNQAVQGGLV